jgi:Associated with zinc fingers
LRTRSPHRVTTAFELTAPSTATSAKMPDRNPDPPDARAEPVEGTVAARLIAASSSAAELDADAAWNTVRHRMVRQSATFNPRSVASIPHKGKKRLSADEARCLIATVKRASKLTVQGASEESVEDLLVQAAAIGRSAPTQIGKALPSPTLPSKASPSLFATGKANPSPLVTPATPMDVASTSQTHDPTPLPTKKRQIPAITGFFPESFNHLAFARKLTGRLNIPPILTRRGIEKRGPAGSLEVKVRVSIQTTSESDYNTTTAILKAEGIESFVYRTLSDRTIKVVVRNLMELTPKEEVQAELVSLGYEVVSVAAMRNFRKVPIPMFLVELRDSATTPEIYNLRTLLHMRVKVEAYRGPGGPRQCHNCCRFGHVTSGCSAHPRCVKCAGAHHTSDCTKSDISLPATCANCNERHTASYRACPVFKAASLAHKARLRNQKQPSDPAKTAIPAKPEPIRYVPAPIPTISVWDLPRTTPIPAAEPIPAAQTTPAVVTAAAKPRPIRTRFPAQPQPLPPKPQREKPTHVPIPNPNTNTSFLRSSSCESDPAPMENQAGNQPSAASISSLIKRGLELLQMKLQSHSSSDRHALSMATLQFVVEAVQMLV